MRPALSILPPALRAVLALGLVLGASACLQSPLKGDPASPYAPGAARGEGVDGLIVGHRLMAAGEYELALKAYYRAAAEHGTSVDVLSAIGSADLKLGRLNQAEQMLRRAVEEDQTFVPAWNNLGVVLMERGKVPEAARVFQTAIESSRTIGEALNWDEELSAAILRDVLGLYGDAVNL